ncbi:hypothetical protein BU25DRAFT_115880 [Macroventuria anomochaeta]|uniref:Uncharacterized protein n=1 Tax=Macroventuria anomochaeta TaxID=301207 RepID=A0ACB6RWQ4_9PLEO|nr:uncharacterized protein BU25DRAFT_115880 [Macroventuria anomochaeta]KAF2625568.1 hypothetical protein BU25DRAFT_115880 [Macroventuria anomochaeta]
MDRTARPGKAARLWLHLVGCFLLSGPMFVVCRTDTSVIVAQPFVARRQGQVSGLIKPEALRMTFNVVPARKTYRQLVTRFKVDRESLDSVS